MKIQAYRRKSESTHEVDGVHYKFAKNERGHYVCDVEEEEAIDRFLSIDDAFKPYGDVPSRHPATSTIAPVKAPSTFVLTNGETKIDLAAMSDDEVKAFAKAHELEGADLRKKGDNLRQSVLDAALKAKPKD